MSDERRTTPTLMPGLLYHDAPAAIEWLCRAFGTYDPWAGGDEPATP